MLTTEPTCQCATALAMIQAVLDRMPPPPPNPNRLGTTAAEAVANLLHQQYARTIAYHERNHVHPRNTEGVIGGVPYSIEERQRL